LQVVQNAEHAPLFTAFIATPKSGGFPRAPTPSWRFATGRFEISSELHEGAQSEPPTKHPTPSLSPSRTQ
jgi:hypothetical protein